MKKDFISLKDFSQAEINNLVELSSQIKSYPHEYVKALNGRTVGLIFQKPSLRTKTAFYVGALQLGGQAIYFAPTEVSLGEREKISDVARTLAHFLDAVVLRTFSHNIILEFTQACSVPVINGLSSLSHPSQALGDLLTIRELKGDIKRIKVAYIGDGNNMCHSLMYGFSILGGNLFIATPNKYQPEKEVWQECLDFAAISGATIKQEPSAQAAVKDADIIYTDVWTSMGSERERQRRKKIFKHFQINEKLVSLAKPDCIIMHCLPAHRGEEITDQVMDSHQAVVFAQAENRLHSAKAILVSLLSKGK